MGRTLRVLLVVALVLFLIPLPAFARPATVPFVTAVTVVNTGNTPVIRGHLQVPLLAATSSAHQAIVAEVFDPAPAAITVDEHGNRQARFDFPRLEPGATWVIRIHYQLTVGAYPTAPADPVKLGEADRAAWLKPEAGMDADHPSIAALAAAVTRGLEGREAARAIFTAVNARLAYDIKAADRPAGALVSLQSGKGVCGDFARLFVALARSAGLPARLVNGYAASGTTPLGPGPDLHRRRHTWAEFYLDDVGWVPVDPTYGRFASLAAGTHLAQNYRDELLRGLYFGGELRVTLQEYIAGE